MTKESRKDYLLRLWKIRQEAEGYDVSGVKTLEEAEHYFDNPIEKEVHHHSTGETTELKTLSDMSYKELQAMGNELGLKTVGVKKEELIVAIEEANANLDTNENPEPTTEANAAENTANTAENPEEQNASDGTVEDIDVSEPTTETNSEIIVSNEGQTPEGE